MVTSANTKATLVSNLEMLANNLEKSESKLVTSASSVARSGNMKDWSVSNAEM